MPALRDRYNIAVVTNDIYTAEDAQFLVRNQALAERIIGVETGGCPHTAIREDASINLEAVDRLNARFPGLDIIFVESGGDNLAATFSPELSDLTIYVIDVSAGDKIPRKGGPGITRSDLLVINKIDLAPLVGASLEVMDRDARKMRGARPFVFSNQKTGAGAGRYHRLHRTPGPARRRGGLSAKLPSSAVGRPGAVPAVTSITETTGVSTMKPSRTPTASALALILLAHRAPPSPILATPTARWLQRPHPCLHRARRAAAADCGGCVPGVAGAAASG